MKSKKKAANKQQPKSIAFKILKRYQNHGRVSKNGEILEKIVIKNGRQYDSIRTIISSLDDGCYRKMVNILFVTYFFRDGSSLIIYNTKPLKTMELESSTLKSLGWANELYDLIF